VGEPIAAVLARTRYVAEDAAERILVDYSPLSSVLSVEAALSKDAPMVHDGWRSNLFLADRVTSGDIAASFGRSFGVERLRLVSHRQAGFPLESRAYVARSDGDSLTLWATSQVPQMMRTGLARYLTMDEARIRVIAPDVGGSFGVKTQLFPEILVVCHLALKTGRPVQWVEDCREHLLASLHAREHLHELEAAHDARGRILGIRARIFVDCGAYSMYPSTAALDGEIAMHALTGPYDISDVDIHVYSVATNKCPIGPYRGVGRPAACLAIERTMDAVSMRLGLDPATVRRRNMVTKFPYRSPTGQIYDSGDYVAAMDLACEVSDYERLRKEHSGVERDGKFLGVGLACFIEQSSFVSARGMKRDRGVGLRFEKERIVVRIDPTGEVQVDVPTHSQGQGHATAFAQIVADELGVRMEEVQIRFGDTNIVPDGIGTFNSRSAVVGGGGVLLATRRANEQLAVIMDLMEQGGDSPLTRPPNVFDIAHWAQDHQDELPASVACPIEGEGSYEEPTGTGTVSFGTHLAVVGVDPETGVVRIMRYVVVEDCGTIINPMIVEGQIHGGIAQGLGGALLEELIYDEHGQLTTTTMADYQVPAAEDIPAIEVVHIETASPFSPNGAKGVAEGGTIAPAAVIASAVQDALQSFDPGFISEVPLTPERVLNLLSGKNRH
jgi:carbon-monoxide dehydrogenase large subunit